MPEQHLTENIQLNITKRFFSPGQDCKMFSLKRARAESQTLHENCV